LNIEYRESVTVYFDTSWPYSGSCEPLVGVFLIFLGLASPTLRPGLQISYVQLAYGSRSQLRYSGLDESSPLER